MSRWVLLSRHPEPRAEDLACIERAPNVRIIDQTLSRAMLLEGPDEAIEALRRQLSDWTLAQETTYAAPRPVKPDDGE